MGQLIRMCKSNKHSSPQVDFGKHLKNHSNRYQKRTEIDIRTWDLAAIGSDHGVLLRRLWEYSGLWAGNAIAC